MSSTLRTLVASPLAAGGGLLPEDFAGRGRAGAAGLGAGRGSSFAPVDSSSLSPGGSAERNEPSMM
ncbi:hypothetical protein [Myxococcus stipitatus]|uniref:hypothetical protein n=1 Tax=Myxococcus stipitatus TaxID=83455 RepID=UPI001E484E0C|nr:hypothetical protein [Myxococcus stipitatus]